MICLSCSMRSLRDQWMSFVAESMYAIVKQCVWSDRTSQTCLSPSHQMSCPMSRTPYYIDLGQSVFAKVSGTTTSAAFNTNSSLILQSILTVIYLLTSLQINSTRKHSLIASVQRHQGSLHLIQMVHLLLSKTDTCIGIETWSEVVSSFTRHFEVHEYRTGGRISRSISIGSSTLRRFAVLWIYKREGIRGCG